MRDTWMTKMCVRWAQETCPRCDGASITCDCMHAKVNSTNKFHTALNVRIVHSELYILVIYITTIITKIDDVDDDDNGGDGGDATTRSNNEFHTYYGIVQ